MVRFLEQNEMHSALYVYWPTICLYAVFDRITLAVPISCAVILLISCRRDVQSADISR